VWQKLTAERLCGNGDADHTTFRWPVNVQPVPRTRNGLWCESV